MNRMRLHTSNAIIARLENTLENVSIVHLLTNRASGDKLISISPKRVNYIHDTLLGINTARDVKHY